MKFLLSVIAVCLVMITAKLYIPEAKADVDGMDAFALMYDLDFQQAVGMVISSNCGVRVNETIRVYDPEYVENIKLNFVAKVKC
jgi:hypothetical protein